MTTPFASICVLTYNHVHFIEECLDSLLMQKTDFPFEIIINDDCSDDGTTEIIRKYAEQYPDVIYPVYHEENLYSQGIRGMLQRFVFPKVRGKYIALCDGDDYWIDPLKLQKQVDFMESHPECSLCCHSVEFLVMHGVTKLNFLEETPKVGFFPFDERLIPLSSIVFRACIAEKIPKHPNFKVTDIPLIKTCSLYGSFFRMEEKMGTYRRHPNGWTNQGALGLNQQVLEHFLAEREVFDDKLIIEVTDKHILKALNNIRILGEWSLARTVLWAIKTVPARLWPVLLWKRLFQWKPQP